MTLKWFKEIFKTENDKEQEKLDLENAKLQNSLLEKELKKEEYIEKTFDDIKKYADQRPYINIKLNNDVLTVVLKDGNILSKSNATKEDFQKARECQDEQELFKIASGEEFVAAKKAKEAEEKALQTMLDGISSLPADHFLFKDDSVYMIDEKGDVINRSLPQLLVEKFARLTGELFFDKSNTEYQALRKFWFKCCLNPSAKSAEDLYTFLQHHQFKIDKHGNFYAYRRVVSTAKANQELVEFVSNAFNKVKAVWKKKPSNFNVYNKLGDFKIVEVGKMIEENNPYWKYEGNLQDLYLDLPNMQEKNYTDNHTHTMDYRVGQSSSIPRDKGDDNNSISCSRGLHIASKAYDYTGFGDTAVLAIINPMDVLAVPLGEVGKLRTCRWFFASTLPDDEQHILDDDDFDVTELGDLFEEECLKGLQDYVQNSYAEEVKRHTFAMPTISAQEISSIVHSLESMKDAISSRVKVVLD